MPQDEPDLDAPGQPLIAKLDGADYPIEQTKRDNYVGLCTAMGGADKVTPESIAAAGLDQREWSYFVVDMLEHDRDLWEHMTSDVARIEANTGEKVDLPKLEKDRLGLLHLKDPPEETPPTDEPEPGAHRKLPSDVGWEED